MLRHVGDIAASRALQQERARLVLSSLGYVSISIKVRTLCMGAPGGLYRPTPRGYNGNPAGRGSHPSVSHVTVLPASFWGPPTSGSRGQAEHCATLLMTQAWSSGHGNSAAVYRAITVAIPHPIRLMACGALEGRRPTLGRPTPTGSSSDALAVFDSPTDRRPHDLRAVQAGVVGTVRGALWLRLGQAWQQYRASPEIFQRYGSL